MNDDQPVRMMIADKIAQTRYIDNITAQFPDMDPLFTATQEPHEGTVFEAIHFEFTYLWYDARWNLAEIKVSGPIRNDDGTYGDETADEEPVAFFCKPDWLNAHTGMPTPPWLMRLAEKRRLLIPVTVIPAQEGQSE